MSWCSLAGWFVVKLTRFNSFSIVSLWVFEQLVYLLEPQFVHEHGGDGDCLKEPV